MGGSNVKQSASSGINERCNAEGTTIDAKQMKRKLSNMKELKNSPNQLDDLAETLIDGEKIKTRYFQHLLKQLRKAVRLAEEEKASFKGGIPNVATKEGCVERLDDAIAPVRQLRVKLVLYEINESEFKTEVARLFHQVHKFTFGPFHAAIQIGNIIIEWGPNSVIIPRVLEGPQHEMDANKTNPILIADIHEPGETPCQEAVNSIAVGMDRDETQRAFDRTIEEVVELTKEKECLINELVALIVRYNTKFHFGVLSNNCHHFVVDVLSVLGITEHMDAFQGRLRDHAAILMSRQHREAAEFNSHEELDNYVQEHLQTMDEDDAQFCYCNYLLFHTWHVRRPGEEAWQCTEGRCMCPALAERLK